MRREAPTQKTCHCESCGYLTIFVSDGPGRSGQADINVGMDNPASQVLWGSQGLAIISDALV